MKYSESKKNSKDYIFFIPFTRITGKGKRTDQWFQRLEVGDGNRLQRDVRELWRMMKLFCYLDYGADYSRQNYFNCTVCKLHLKNVYLKKKDVLLGFPFLLSLSRILGRGLLLA